MENKAGVGLWHMNNNNNNLLGTSGASKDYKKNFNQNAQKQRGVVTKQTIDVVTPTVGRVEDEGGGTEHRDDCIGDGVRVAEKNEIQLQQNGDDTTHFPPIAQIPTTTIINKPSLAIANDIDTFGVASSVAAAAVVSPTDIVAVGSNRTSINNSTENLSYSSDNYYGDDLILLDEDDEDDGDVEAEEISLNSDDCVYAYRGDGADFELAALDAIAGRGGVVGLDASGIADDETDFLEMDFEPDPLSEVEYGGSTLEQPNAFLMQRDFSHLGGRHSANIALQVTPSTQRQHFSSPIDDHLQPQEALQTQSQRLSKNFARISLHLDQIKGGSNAESADRDDSSNKRVVTDAPDTTQKSQTAHSLPNTLYTNFGREKQPELSAAELTKSPAKITGAKPKRFATYSMSSSTSSKGSSKSRTSLRSAGFIPTHGGNSASFDERSVSCTDFRAAPQMSSQPTNDPCTPLLAAAAAVVIAASAAANCMDLNTNGEETCLDCLEKEFLANTIGKALDLSDCNKCRKRCSSISYYTQTGSCSSSRGRSGTPTNFFRELRDDCMFDIPTPRKRNDEWPSSMLPTTVGQMSAAASTNKSTIDFGVKAGLPLNVEYDDIVNQRGTITATAITKTKPTCDNFSRLQLLNDCLLTESEVVTISIVNLNEETLVQALDKLHIIYDVELLKAYFNNESNSLETVMKDFKSLKDFLLYESKRHCNHVKIKKLIDLATAGQVDVKFTEFVDNVEDGLIPVKVHDILQQWLRSKDLASLQTLDKRFKQANVLGKVANIIRQTQERSATSSSTTTTTSSSSSSKSPSTSQTYCRPLSEVILIPQYYPSGELTLTRKCSK